MFNALNFQITLNFSLQIREKADLSFHIHAFVMGE